MPWDEFFPSGVSFTLWLADVQPGCPQEHPGPSCQVVSKPFLGEGFTEAAAGHRSRGSVLSHKLLTQFLCSPGQVQWRHHRLSWSCASTDGFAGIPHPICVDTGHSLNSPRCISLCVCETDWWGSDQRGPGVMCWQQRKPEPELLEVMDFWRKKQTKQLSDQWKASSVYVMGWRWDKGEQTKMQWILLPHCDKKHVNWGIGELCPQKSKAKESFAEHWNSINGKNEKNPQFFGVCFLLLGPGFLWSFFFSLETKEWRTE